MAQFLVFPSSSHVRTYKNMYYITGNIKILYYIMGNIKICIYYITGNIKICITLREMKFGQLVKKVLDVLSVTFSLYAWG